MNNSKVNLLNINNKVISFYDIKHKNYLKLELTEYELKTLNFCNEWLNNKNEFIINTSGSTGTPKAIKLKRNLMITSAKLTGNFLNIKPKDKILIVLSTEYIAGLMMIVRGFVLNLKMEIFEPSSNPLKNFNDINYDLASFVPLQIYEIINNTPEKINLLNSIKNILIGGGTINHNTEKSLEQLKCNIYNTYGMTETITHIALKKINGKDKSKYFTTLKDTKIAIDNRNCLIINSSVTDYKDIVTNDIVEIINDKQFNVLGRIDNIINSGGIKIQLEKIENIISKILNEININKNFFAYGIDDEKLGQKLILIFESEPFEDNTLNILNSNLKNNFKKYEIPKNILFIKKFVFTETSKIDRKETFKILNCNF